MKKWNLKQFSQDIIDIPNLLNEYSKSLSEVTNNELTGIIKYEIINNNIYYFFNIRMSKLKYSVNIFTIRLVDLNENLLLTVHYLNPDDDISFSLTPYMLENKIDELITGEKMGKYIGYLLMINNKNEE